MKLNAADTIRTKVATFIGVITWIHWGNNEGTVDLGGELGEVPCRFRYMGQHWIFNMDAYPEEDAGSHGAFAFCHGDKVIVLQKQKPEDLPPPGWEYVAVAIMEDDNSALIKRNAWPLFRLGHEAVVLNAEYSYAGGHGAGFPFITPEDRWLIGEYTDQSGNKRAFGTLNGSGNQRLVITRDGEETFIAHAAHEFTSADEPMPYVPDALMQTVPNYKGRIIGMSNRDEILIDNIPVMKIGTVENDPYYGSDRAKTHRLIHVNEQSDILTVMYIVMDFHYYWYDNHPLYQSQGFLWPAYGFKVTKGTIDLGELCIYDSMQQDRDTLPQLNLTLDQNASWRFDDIAGYTWPEHSGSADRGYRCYGNVITNEFLVGCFGEDIELYFYVDEGVGTNCRQRKVSFRVNTSPDGTYSVAKDISTPEMVIDRSLYEHERVDDYTELEGNDYSGVLTDRTAILGDGITGTIVSSGGSQLTVKLQGKEEAISNWSIDYVYPYTYNEYTAVHDTLIEKIYSHAGPHASFEIARDVYSLQGTVHDSETSGGNSRTDSVVASVKFVVFTFCDVANGVYGFWEFTPLDAVSVSSLLDGTSITNHPDTGKFVKWQHFVCSRHGRTMTHQYQVQIPYGTEDVTLLGAGINTRKAINGLIGARSSYFMNNPTVYYKIPIAPVPDFYESVVEYDGLLSWLWHTDDVHVVQGRTLVENEISYWPDFYAHPFTTPRTYSWPYFRNSGNPFMGIEIVSNHEGNIYLPTILFSESMGVSGMSYGVGEFSYSFRLNGTGSPVVVNSPGLARLLQCTGREDMALTLD